MFTKTLLIAAIAGLAAAAPAKVARDDNNALLAIALHSGDPSVHQRAITENGLRFWIGKDTTTYCPEQVGANCPPGNTTSFSKPTSGVEGNLNMNTEVPGGQRAYVLPNGELAVTQAHSGGMGDGGVASPFLYTAQATSDTVGTLVFNDKSFTACPSDEADVYQIYATGASEFVRTDCTDIAFGTVESNTEYVWQYI